MTIRKNQIFHVAWVPNNLEGPSIRYSRKLRKGAYHHNVESSRGFVTWNLSSFDLNLPHFYLFFWSTHRLSLVNRVSRVQSTNPRSTFGTLKPSELMSNRPTLTSDSSRFSSSSGPLARAYWKNRKINSLGMTDGKNSPDQVPMTAST